MADQPYRYTVLRFMPKYMNIVKHLLYYFLSL
jgi:hypothetical protein